MARAADSHYVKVHIRQCNNTADRIMKAFFDVDTSKK